MIVRSLLLRILFANLEGHTSTVLRHGREDTSGVLIEESRRIFRGKDWPALTTMTSISFERACMLNNIRIQLSFEHCLMSAQMGSHCCRSSTVDHLEGGQDRRAIISPLTARFLELIDGGRSPPPLDDHLFRSPSTAQRSFVNLILPEKALCLHCTIAQHLGVPLPPVDHPSSVAATYPFPSTRS